MNKFRSIFVLWVLGFAILSTGCSRESQQQYAFINFLQKDVIPRNSGILIPNANTRKKIGSYSTHYSVIVEYNKDLLEKVSRPLEKAQREYQDAVKPETSIKDRKEAIFKYQEALKSIKEILDAEAASVELKFAGMTQPDEVKDVYNQAFEKLVRTPTIGLKTFLIPATEEVLNKNLEFLEYISKTHGVEIKDGVIQVDKNIKGYESILIQLQKMQGELRKMDIYIEEKYADFMRQAISR